MEVSNEARYRFDKVFLYPPGSPAVRRAVRPLGEAVVETHGSKGRLVFAAAREIRTALAEYPGRKFPVVLRQVDSSAETVVGFIADKQLAGQWDFAADPGRRDGEPDLVRYILFVKTPFGPWPGRVLLTAGVKLVPGIRDTKIVGFDKEAKTRKSRNVYEANPLFKKVEPFHPPIPNSVWWQISLSPDLSNSSLSQSYCPRQKSYQAMF